MTERQRQGEMLPPGSLGDDPIAWRRIMAWMVRWSTSFGKPGFHPRIKSEGRLFPDHALTARSNE
jgi:hypothetical protein